MCQTLEQWAKLPSLYYVQYLHDGSLKWYDYVSYDAQNGYTDYADAVIEKMKAAKRFRSRKFRIVPR